MSFVFLLNVGFYYAGRVHIAESVM